MPLQQIANHDKFGELVITIFALAEFRDRFELTATNAEKYTISIEVTNMDHEQMRIEDVFSKLNEKGFPENISAREKVWLTNTIFDYLKAIEWTGSLEQSGKET